jgi:hypothetical protein
MFFVISSIRRLYITDVKRLHYLAYLNLPEITIHVTCNLIGSKSLVAPTLHFLKSRVVPSVNPDFRASSRKVVAWGMSQK